MKKKQKKSTRSRSKLTTPLPPPEEIILKARVYVLEKDQSGYRGRTAPFLPGYVSHTYFEQSMATDTWILGIKGYTAGFPCGEYLVYLRPMRPDNLARYRALFPGAKFECGGGKSVEMTGVIEEILAMETEKVGVGMNPPDGSFVSLESAFVQPEEAHHLYLFGQQLKTIGEELAFFPNLETLDVADNLLQQLPGEVTQLKKLKKVRLGYNPHLDLEDAIEKLATVPDLAVLDLSGMNLSALPASLAKLSKLEELYLSDNQFADISEVVLSLPRLKVLDLSGNQLTAVDNRLGVLQQLKRLDLSRNRIKKFGLEYNSKLEFLNLNSNALEEIPPVLPGYAGLAILLLAENALTEVPDGIGGLAELILLDVKKNPISRDL